MRGATIRVETAQDMRALGATIAATARPGDLVVLNGELGAGKTTFAQGVGAGLGVDGAVVSPTFVIARVHPGGRLPLVHVDAYRLSSATELDDLDLEASLEDSLTVVEWGEGLVEGLSAERLVVRIERSAEAGTETREVTLTGIGDRWSSLPELPPLAPQR